MPDPRQERLEAFTAWVKQHLTGDEKGEAQIFMDRLFKGFGHEGLKEAGATCELRVKKNDRGGTAFADLVWPPTVLIEMKRRGEDLSRHYTQAFDYWTKVLPHPRYVVLCNFDEFWVYDFNAQLYAPMDKVSLDDLPVRYGPLTFLFPSGGKPVFGNDHESVTREAADDLAWCFNSLVGRHVERGLAQRFILQMLVTLFAEDIGLLPRYFVRKLLDECVDPPSAFDLLGGLFTAMNTREGVGGGRYKGVDYFNGGLFNEAAALELDKSEIERLRKASNDDWSKVRPEIFGTLFEHSLGKQQRHAFGAHFTSHTDILKIVRPTIIEPWTTAIERARTLKELARLRNLLSGLRVLDPACGSGNFLYIAYREMRKLEARIAERQNELEKGMLRRGQVTLGVVRTKQFFGLDIDPFAVELAKVTLVLARKLAIDELHSTEPALPLDNLDDNFRACDALVTIPEGGIGPARTPWPDAHVIIGNPPFLGSKDLKPERGDAYAKELRALYPEIPGMADYCVYWIRRAHDHLPTCTPENALIGRAGLVGTQNIRNNKSREGGLDHVVKSGVIVEAVDNQPWSGEANVHVSIVNWVKIPEGVKAGAEQLVPARRKLWHRAVLGAEDSVGAAGSRTTVMGRRGRVRKDKSFELTYRECTEINSALSDTSDVSQAAVLIANTKPQRVFQGLTPGHDGFVLTPSEAAGMVVREPRSADIVHPYLIGRELVSGDGKPARFILDFEQRSQLESSTYSAAFARVESLVLPARKAKAEIGKTSDGELRPHHRRFLDRWWQLSWGRADMLAAFQALRGRYIACSRVTKRPIFVFISNDVRPGDALQTFAFDDDYSFGILSSSVHWQWFVTKCSKLKSDFRYTPASVFDTFPWPQSPTEKEVLAVAEAGLHVRMVRGKHLPASEGGLRALYRTLELPGQNPLKVAHEALDAAVVKAYGFSARRDVVQQLLDLNRSVAADEARGRMVTGPGIPRGFSKAAKLITKDCVHLADPAWAGQIGTVQVS